MDAQGHRRYTSLGAAVVSMLALLACVWPAPAAIAGQGAGAAPGHSGATGAKAAMAATPTRPLCRAGWRLRGSRGLGFVCKRHGHRARPSCRAQQQLRRQGHGYLCLPTPAGSPTPQTTPTQPVPPPVSPTPAPSPTSGPTKDQYLVNGAFEYAKSYGEKELAEMAYTHVYYWRIEANGCALIGSNTAECVLMLYKEVEVLNYDPSSIANNWFKAIYLLGVYYEDQGPELGYRVRLGQIGDWSVGPWKWL
ncbi:MAG TPA: hypothetical protein VK605_02865 [Solirubrobacteraceae bacterium]|nr:hypothetical protein [Solirubrobacteraceae bacterium]